MSAASETVNWRAVLSGPNRKLFLVLCFGVWLHAADSTVIATLMPVVVADLGGETILSWNYVLYRLATIAAACCGALIGRRLGLRRAMVGAALFVCLGCAISAVTPSMEGMLFGRAVQGLGGGMLVALVAIGVVRLFPSSFTPRVMAAISAVWGSSAFLGPLVGGVFAEFGDWRYGFWAFAAQAVLLALLLHWALPADERIDADRTRIPWRRLAVLSGSIMAVAVAGVGAGAPIFAAILCIAGAAGLALFIRLDRTAGPTDRLLPKRVADLKSPVGVGFVGIFLIATATIPFTVYGPVLMNLIHGVTPLQAGYMIAMESVSWTLGALLFSSLAGAAQIRIVRLAFLFIFIASIGLALFVTPGPVWALLPFLFLTGLGFGACFGHVLQRCVEAAGEEDRDRAAGAITTVQTIGYALSAALAGLIANSVGYSDGAGIDAAQAAGRWVFIAMIPVAGAAALLIRRLR